MPDNPSHFHRRTIRLQGYDYTLAGAYFVTLVTRHRELLFGDVINGGIRSNYLGQIVKECWQEIPKHFPFVEVEPFVVMPNHIHGIITINEDDRSRGTISSMR